MKGLRRVLALGLAMAIAVLAVVSARSADISMELELPPLTLEAAELSLEEMAPGIYGLVASTDFPTENDNVAICNGAIVIGDEEVLLVDPFQNERLANLALSQAGELTDLPVRYVLNTHYHFDHTGGNAAIAARDIPLLGRGPIRPYMLERNGESDPNPTPPQIVADGETSVWLGDREVRIQLVEGHSGGTDVVAYIPDADVLIAGDMLFHQRFPYTGDGDLRQWQASLDDLIADYPTATILPGHGPVTDVEGLEKLADYFDYLETLAAAWEAAGLSQEEAIASASEIPEAYEDYKFKAMYEGNLTTAYEQFVLGTVSFKPGEL